MMYAINSDLLKNNEVLEMINSMDCVLLFEPKDDIYFISFRNEQDLLKLQTAVNKLIM